jgi:hypothetical protein
LRIHLGQGLHDLLAATHSDEPVMDDSNFHLATFSLDSQTSFARGQIRQPRKGLHPTGE